MGRGAGSDVEKGHPLRLLEILILVLNLVAIVGPLLPFQPKPRWLAFVPSATLGLILVHLVVEQYRWQMVPVYLLSAVIFLLSLRRMREPASASPRRWRAVLLSALGVLVLLIVGAPPVLFPVPRLPVPTGPYQVGTISYDFVDATRDELYTVAPSDKRELMVQIWYPAAPPPGARTGVWMERLDVAGPAIAEYLGLPSFVLDHTSLIRTNSYPGAPVAETEARYPVVIYSHGWNGFRTINTNQMEALASHGYIAVGIDHTYGAMVTVFSDGRVALNNPAALPADAPADEYQRASETLEATFAADVRFVLDQLELLNAGKPDAHFAGRLDLGRVGLFGHSTGGGAIVLACSRDPRCKAGLGMDAWLVPVPRTVIPNPLMQRFLFMRSEVWATEKNDARLAELYAGLRHGGYRLTIQGTKHYDFTMLPLLTPLAPALGLKGPLDGQRTMRIVTEYLLAFFDQQLKGQAAPLLDGPAPDYPEIVFESR
jgi:predicted dienelactone hydrolase